MNLDVTDLPPDTVLLGKYRVLGTVGTGGMGVVVAAEHISLRSKVAIKFMLPQLVAKETVVKRFVNEARAASRIQSDHVCRVLDVGSMTGEGLPNEGIPYMVMEFLHGQDLAQHLRAGAHLTVPQVVAYGMQTIEALAHAHRAGIIHRDVKPANLFLAEYEGGAMVKVLDFGISKILDEEPEEMNLTKTTTVLGSGLYMSPEQMRSAKNVDFRTDIYSLGVCLFELLAGTQPFTAENFSELVVKVNIDPPTPLRKHRPDVPADFAAVLEKAYARRPQDRFQNVQAFAAALEPFADPDHLPQLKQLPGLSLPGAVVASSFSGDAGRDALADTAEASGASSSAASVSSVRRGRSAGWWVVGGVALATGVLATLAFLRRPEPDRSEAASARPAIASAAPAPVAPTSAGAGERDARAVVPASSSGSPPATELATNESADAPKPLGASRASATAVAPRTPKPKCVPKRDPVTGLMMPCL